MPKFRNAVAHVQHLENLARRGEFKTNNASSVKSKRKQISTQRPASQNQEQLPLWSDDRRGIPNDLVRSALFTIGNSRRKREFCRAVIIKTLGNIKITYTGEELRQMDEDVFLQLVHLARLVPLGSPIEFSAHSLLKALSWPTDSKAYTRLRQSIHRLSVTGLTIENDHQGYNGSLIRDFAWKKSNEQSSRLWMVRLEPSIISLFKHVSYSQIDWEQRLKLGDLAKWLHSFYYTHQNPYPMKVKTLHVLCGSTTKSQAKFRQMLRSALEELVDANFLRHWDIDKKSDLVTVSRIHTQTIERKLQ